MVEDSAVAHVLHAQVLHKLRGEELTLAEDLERWVFTRDQPTIENRLRLQVERWELKKPAKTRSLAPEDHQDR